MNLKDILELAKQGYKPNDIKELIALSREDNSKDDPEDNPKDDPEDEPKDDPKDDPKDKKIAELQKLLQNKDVSSKEKIRTSTDVLNELFKNL